MNFTLQINQRSLRKVLREIKRRGGAIERAGAAALRAEAENVMTESKRQVPVDTGALRSTGHVDAAEQRGSKLSVRLSYGGPAGSGGGKHVGYAVFVHEDLTARHTVGKAKYLEDPVKRAVSGMGRRLARLIKRGAGL